MKQIDIIKTYGQKRVLIVDDSPDMRTNMKRILVDYGSETVDTAANAEDAIELSQRFPYDMVISDYNLGAGKNGQQLLEELRFQSLLAHSALFIMITAENASQYVLHALEYQPDDYLSKPITHTSLRPRLDQALLKNETLLPVKRELDNHQPGKAIKLCEKFLESENRYRNDVIRIYAKLLTKQHNYQQALNAYSMLDPNRRPLWSLIGMSENYINLNIFVEADKILNRILEEAPHCVEAHDLLALSFEKQGNPNRAQHELEQAIKLSPFSVERQRKMGKISQKVGDIRASLNAMRTVIKQSKNSCQESANDLIDLVEGIAEIAQEPGEDLEKLNSESSELLKQLEKKYSTQPIFNMRGKLLEAEMHDLNGRKEQADALCQNALDIFANIKLTVIGNTPIQVCIDCAKAFMARGHYDEGEQLLQEVAKVNRDPQLAIAIDKLLRDPVTQEGIQHAAKENKLGISYYQKEDFKNAIGAFTKVLTELPNHIGLNLNLIQAIISKSKQSELTEKNMNQIDSSLKRIGAIDENSKYRERYQYLIKQYEKLKTAQTAS